MPKSGLWLYHGPPKNDELFASWLTRLAFWQGHDNLPSFFNNMFSDLPKVTPSRLLHGEVSKEWIRHLSDVTGQSVENLERTASASEWTAILDMDHRSSFSVTLYRYCPLCLKEDKKKGNCPYLRQIWSFPPLVICCKHRILLQDTCPRCNYSIRTDYTSIWKYAHSKKCQGGINLVCPSCDADLSNAPRIHIDPKDPLMELSHFFRDALNKPETKVPLGKSSISSREFISTFFILTRFFAGYFRKNPRFTEELLEVLRQVSIWRKSWPEGFEKWLPLKAENHIWTNEVRLRSFLWNNLVVKGKHIPAPLKKHSKKEFERKVRAWTFEKAVKFMWIWARENPKKYPRSDLPELSSLSCRIRKQNLTGFDGTIIKSWIQFLDILRSMGIDIPSSPKATGRKWTLELALGYLELWLLYNPHKYPSCNSPELRKLEWYIRNRGLKTEKGTEIRSWSKFLEYAMKMRPNSIRASMTWGGAVNILKRFLKDKPKRYPSSSRPELSMINSKLRSYGLTAPDGTKVRTWPVFLEKAGYKIDGGVKQ